MMNISIKTYLDKRRYKNPVSMLDSVSSLHSRSNGFLLPPLNFYGIDVMKQMWCCGRLYCYSYFSLAEVLLKSSYLQGIVNFSRFMLKIFLESSASGPGFSYNFICIQYMWRSKWGGR